MRFLIPSPPKFSKVTSDFKCLSGEETPHSTNPKSKIIYGNQGYRGWNFQGGVRELNFPLLPKFEERKDSNSPYFR